MSKELEQLALRKQLLQARSALYRLKMQHEIRTIGQSLQWAKVGSKVIGSYPIRSALLGFAYKVFQGTRGARLVGFATRAFIVAKTVSSIINLFRSSADRQS